MPGRWARDTQGVVQPPRYGRSRFVRPQPDQYTRDEGVWIGAIAAHKIERVDTKYGVVALLTVNGQPEAIASADGGPWIAISAD